jgi:galactokinase
VVVDISETDPLKGETGTTEALVRGIAAQFSQQEVPVRGFTANANSTVLSGSGLSSSAAVEVLFGTIFDGLYGGAKRSAVEIAQMGQKAENLYFGKPCGLMDQVASASGGAVAIDFADPTRPVVRRVNFDLASAGYALCVVDTGGSHADLTAEYAAVPSEMKAVAQLCGGQVLRDISKETLLQSAQNIRGTLGDRSLLRAFHFLAENERVSAMLAALEEADSAKTTEEKRSAIEAYLLLVNESGNSSWELLQNVFTPKNPKEQGVSVALAMTGDFLRSLGDRKAARERLPGAYRVHGGGFAGTIQAYIPQNDLDAYIRWMGSVFGPQAVTVLRIRPVGAAELHFF